MHYVLHARDLYTLMFNALVSKITMHEREMANWEWKQKGIFAISLGVIFLDNLPPILAVWSVLIVQTD